MIDSLPEGTDTPPPRFAPRRPADVTVAGRPVDAPRQRFARSAAFLGEQGEAADRRGEVVGLRNAFPRCESGSMGMWRRFRRLRHDTGRSFGNRDRTSFPSGTPPVGGDLPWAAIEQWRAEVHELRLLESSSWSVPKRVHGIARVLRRYMDDLDAAVIGPAIWQVLPEVGLVENARQRCKYVKDLLGKLRDTVLNSPMDPALVIGGANTTIADALRIEAERISRGPAAGDGEHRLGYRAAQAGFAERMEDRARELERAPKGNLRRGVVGPPVKRPEPAEPASVVLTALRDTLAALPAQRQARHEEWTTRVVAVLLPFRPDDSTSAESRSAVAHAVLRSLPELDSLDETLDELLRMEERLAEARSALVAQRGHLNDEVIRWRNTLARELRQQADHCAGATGISLNEDFVIGYALANEEIARLLRERADRLAVADLPRQHYSVLGRTDEF
jgi:hypothetical protein